MWREKEGKEAQQSFHVVEINASFQPSRCGTDISRDKD
jgi:hypothetical protein